MSSLKTTLVEGRHHLHLGKVEARTGVRGKVIVTNVVTKKIIDAGGCCNLISDGELASADVDDKA